MIFELAKSTALDQFEIDPVVRCEFSGFFDMIFVVAKHDVLPIRFYALACTELRDFEQLGSILMDSIFMTLFRLAINSECPGSLAETVKGFFVPSNGFLRSSGMDTQCHTGFVGHLDESQEIWIEYRIRQLSAHYYRIKVGDDFRILINGHVMARYRSYALHGILATATGTFQGAFRTDVEIDCPFEE